jgi:hypothetical protein
MTGHLECPFDCGVFCSSLEHLSLHIEVDHREDNNFSPFVVREPQEPPAPPLPSRAPPPLPSTSEQEVRGPFFENDASPGSSEPELDLSIICDGCGEQLFVPSDLDEHHEMHEAERLMLSDDTSPQSSAMNTAAGHSSSSHHSYIPSDPNDKGFTPNFNFSTDLPAELRHQEQRKMQQQEQDRHGMGRKFLSMMGLEKKPQKPARDTDRLGV